MTNSQYNRCWIELSRSSFAYNIEQLKKFLGPDQKILAIVKADGYGHGGPLMASWLNSCGVYDFGVACTMEAQQLRDYGVNGDILILSYVDEVEWEHACQLDAIMSIVSLEHARRLNKWAGDHGRKVRVEVKTDSGMRRLGINTECPDEEIREIYSSENLLINGTYTHLCVADSFKKTDVHFSKLQNERFSGFVNRVKAMGLDPGRTHLSASSGILNYPQFKYDYVRPGFVMYGYEVGEVKKRYDTKPVLSYYSKVELVKDVQPDEGISYGRLYFTEGVRRIATVSVGYADGYPRCMTGKAQVLVRGHRAPVVGRICMDQLMIDVTDIPGVKEEDKVTLIGCDGNERITMEDIAEWAGTVGSDIACGFIRTRVKKHIVR